MLIPTPLICSSALSNSSKSDTPTYIFRTVFHEHFISHNNCNLVYTDASKSQYGSGFAVLFPSQYFQFQLPSVSSVLTTELYAVLFALRKLLSYPSSSFVIFTGSQNSLSLLRSLYIIHPLVREIQ